MIHAHTRSARPSFGSEESDALLTAGMIAQGPVTAAFEEEFAAYCGISHAVAVSNGTTALHAALLVAGVGPGDEVIGPGLHLLCDRFSGLDLRGGAGLCRRRSGDRHDRPGRHHRKGQFEDEGRDRRPPLWPAMRRGSNQGGLRR